MHICTLQPEHIASVVQVWNDAVEAEKEEEHAHDALSVERLEAIVSDPNFLPSGAVVALKGEEVVGFALGYVQTVDVRRVGELEGLPARLAGVAVAPEHRRQGIGRRLLEAVEEAVAERGKDAISFETWAMPLRLVRGAWLDTGPYRFLLACGYRPVGHELFLRNDLEKFRLREEILRRREELAGEGIEYRFYTPSDREDLLAFMARCFPGGWHVAIERAIQADPPPSILLVVASGTIVGFMGPFSVSRPGGPGSFSSPGVAREWRGRGVGKVMFNLGLDWLKQQGATETTYSTGVTNPARFIYLDSGAEYCGVFCCNLRKQLARG